MQIRAKLSRGCLALHGSDHFAVNNEAANVTTAGLFDEFLYQDVGLVPHEGLNHAFRSLLGFREHHANPLRAFQKFDDQWRATHFSNQATDIVRRVGEGCDRYADASARQ